MKIKIREEYKSFLKQRFVREEETESMSDFVTRAAHSLLKCSSLIWLSFCIHIKISAIRHLTKIVILTPLS